MTTQPNILLPRATLERLLATLSKSYDRHPTREVKQATETIRHLLQSEKNDRIAPTV